MFLRRKLVKSRLKIAGKQPLGSRDRTSNHSTRISSPRSTLANIVQPPSKSSVKEKTNTSQLENTNFRPFKIIPRGMDIFLISSPSNFFQRKKSKFFFNRISILPSLDSTIPFERVNDHSQVETIKIGACPLFSNP